ncbi:MAG: hypothetical protein ACHQ53_10595 [Polyangiales bacterium]
MRWRCALGVLCGALSACSSGGASQSGGGSMVLAPGTTAGVVATPPTVPGSDPGATAPAAPAAPPNATTGPAQPNPAQPSPGVAGAAAPAPSPMAAAQDPNTVTITMDPFTVPAGDEVFMCQDFDNPFGGMDVAVGRSQSDMSPGSHHLHVFYGIGSPADRTVQPCANPNEFRPMIHISTLPHLVSEYPTGTAAKLKGTIGLRLQVHYLNTTSAPLQASVVVKLTKVDPTSVQRWVAQIHFNRISLSIPPGMSQPVTTSCAIPSTFGPIGLLSGISHMHKRGVHFVATTSTGTALLDTTNWDDPPPTIYDTPVMLNPGDSISWSCTYDNTTGATLTYGDSAEKNEMCIYIARFFSSPNGDDLECETPLPTDTAISKSN